MLAPGAGRLVVVLGAVGTEEITDDSVTAADRLDEAGIEFTAGFITFDLQASELVVRSIDVTAPTSGVVTVNASGSCTFDSDALCICSISETSVLSEIQVAETGGVITNDKVGAFDLTAGFEVDAGTSTFNLVCLEQVGPAAVANPQMTAIFTPTRY